MRIYKLDRGYRYGAACAIERAPLLDWNQIAELTRRAAGAQVVFFYPELVVGPAHLLTAVDYAVRAFRTGRNVARSLHVEAFLFAAATNEISRALRLFQPSFEEELLYAVVVAETHQLCGAALEALRGVPVSLGRVDRSEEAARLLAKELGIDDREIAATHSSDFAEAVEKCLLSRMAMLYISR